MNRPPWMLGFGRIGVHVAIVYESRCPSIVADRYNYKPAKWGDAPNDLSPYRYFFAASGHKILC
jgi:hypothetical protein